MESVFHYYYAILLNISVNHKDSIPFVKNGVFSMINLAINDPYSFACTLPIDASASTNNRTNKSKYTSKNPRNDPNNLLIGRNNGILAKKSNMDAIICNTILVTKKINIKAIPL